MPLLKLVSASSTGRRLASEGGRRLYESLGQISESCSPELCPGTWGVTMTADTDLYWCSPSWLVCCCLTVGASRVSRHSNNQGLYGPSLHSLRLPGAVGPNGLKVGNQEGFVVKYKHTLTEAAVSNTYTLTKAAAGRFSIVEESAEATARASRPESTSVCITRNARRCRVDVPLSGHPETLRFLTTLVRPRKTYA
jgi:hypothetical protein